MREPLRPQAADAHTGYVYLSRTETEVLCLKAARGAGYSWGLAEEAGVAAGQLWAQGIDGAAAVLACLALAVEHRPETQLILAQGHWSAAQRRTLCPIVTGTTLLDYALLESGPLARPTRIDAVHQPVLLLSFLARAAQLAERTICVEWSGGAFDIGADTALIGAEYHNFACAPHTDCVIQSTERPAPPRASTHKTAATSRETVAALNVYAMKTTVPATAQSRLSGAGAGINDND